MSDGLIEYNNIDKDIFDFILDKMKNLKVALVGDLCLDVYWQADMTKSELSRETPHYPLPIIDERMSPGAGGNVAANIAALDVKSIKVVGVIGNDWRGKELVRELNIRGIDTELLVACDNVTTNAYCKPIRCGISDVEYEDPRIDFTNYEKLPINDENKLIEKIKSLSNDVDVICVADQFLNGCVTKKVRDVISQLALKGQLVVVDSRDRVDLYRNVTLKPNEIEGLKAVFNDVDYRCADFEMFKKTIKVLNKKTGCNVCMTLGRLGCLYQDEFSLSHINTNELEPPLDICGGGDTFISAFACALATGVKGHQAAAFANIASGITIKKIGMTGTATKQEIRSRYTEILK